MRCHICNSEVEKQARFETREGEDVRVLYCPEDGLVWLYYFNEPRAERVPHVSIN